jgi:hypothetical protein
MVHVGQLSLLSQAVMSAVLAVEIVPAVAGKLALINPAGIVTELCTGRSELSLVSVTGNPTPGAGPEIVTVQEVDCWVYKLF